MKIEEIHISTAAFLVAFASFALTCYEGFAMRRHYRLSVAPRVVMNVQSNENRGEIEVVVSNCGLGPAEITSGWLLQEGRDPQPLKEGFGIIQDHLRREDSDAFLAKRSWYPVGSYLKTGEQQTVAKFMISGFERFAGNNSEEAKDQFKKLMHTIDKYGFDLKFRSLYKDENEPPATILLKDYFWEDESR